MKPDRGTCRGCGRQFTVRQDGKVWGHGGCPVGGGPPAEAKPVYGAEYEVVSVCRRGRWIYATYFETDDPRRRGWFGCEAISN